MTFLKALLAIFELFLVLFWVVRLGTQRKTDDPMIHEIEEELPEEAVFHNWLGDAYRADGILYRAREEYEQAAIIDPKNDSYRRKLKRVELDIEFGN